MKKILFLLYLPLSLYGQIPPVEAIRQWVKDNGAHILQEFIPLLKIPNHASDLPNIKKNADLLQQLFTSRGFKMQLLERLDAPPIVYGEYKVPGATRTWCFYVHYDGQPVDVSRWQHDPFEPVLYDGPMDKGGKQIPFPQAGEAIEDEWRIYARSSSDDKAPIMALIGAVDALKQAGLSYTSNIKLFFDGEEESGSPNVQAYLQNHPHLFEDIDVWLICDGSVFQTGAPQFKFGGRGITSMELTVYGATRPLHSGHYGNWAPVPGQMLARLLTSMKDENGKVLIEGFYDSVEPISAIERDQINKVPPVEAQLKKELGLVVTEGEGQRLNQRLLLPSLTVRGLSSGNVGAKSRNIIPNTATATLGMRLVKGNDPEKMLDLVEAHIKKEGWHIVYEEPDMVIRLQHPKIVKVTRSATGLKAAKTSMDHNKVKPIIETMREFTNDKMVLLPSSGASNRVYYVIFEVLKKPGIGVNIVNHDNNQHAANENLRLGNLWYGVELMAVLLTMD
ncbi:MAG: M20/M25/M40 family metallo-hydrolase [Cyclobacteriaceae bacterium]|nr:M20/M25/M40 family metallo-hydrolase [Cyclobacteriaceae bacterium]